MEDFLISFFQFLIEKGAETSTIIELFVVINFFTTFINYNKKIDAAKQPANENTNKLVSDLEAIKEELKDVKYEVERANTLLSRIYQSCEDKSNSQ